MLLYPQRASMLVGLALAGAIVSGPSVAGTMSMSSAFKVSESGAATLSVPITVPPGLAGVQPELNLNYSSQAGKGVLGTGWSISGISVITLCPQTIAQDGTHSSINYDVNDRYCLDGQRLVPESGSYTGYGSDQFEYRTEIDSFSRITSQGTASGGGPLSFTVKTKLGETIRYGGTSGAYADGKNRIRVWPMYQVVDSKGNEINLQHEIDPSTGETNVIRIIYGGNPSAGIAWNVNIEFYYSDRSDVETMFVGGVTVKLAKRLDSIETRVNHALVRRYDFSYSQSETTKSSRLREIKECATNSSGTLECLPPISFEFDNTADLRFSGSNTFSGPQSSSSGLWGAISASLLSRSRRTVDFNGDGRTDLVQNVSGSIWTVCRSNGNASFSCSDWPSTLAQNEKVVFGDINGDGLTDITRLVSGGWGVCLSTGSQFNCSLGSGPADADVLTGDFDGDGRLDLADDTSSGWRICLSTGASFSCSPWGNAAPAGGVVADVDGDGRSDLLKRVSGNSWSVCRSETGSFSCGTWTGPSGGGPVADFNGDGLADLANHLSGSNWQICLSTGAGFNCSAQAVTDSTGVFGDFNGDGKADIAQRTSGSTWKVCLSRGTSFECGVWTGGIALNSNPVYVGDYDGDGQADLLQPLSGTQWAIATSLARNNDRIRVFYDGIGQETEVTYTDLRNTEVYTPGAGAVFPIMDVQAPVEVVQKVSAHNGTNGLLTTNYRFGGLRATYNGRGSLGFQWIESTEESSGITQRTEYRQDWPFNGRPSLLRKSIPGGGNNGMLYEAEYTYWCQSGSAGGPNCYPQYSSYHQPYLSKAIERSWDLNGTPLPQITTESMHDLWGNAYSIKVSTNDGHIKTTSNSFNVDVANWRLNRLSRSTVTHEAPGVPTLTRRSEFTYDSFGLLTKEAIEPQNSQSCLVTVYSYDSVGNRTSKTLRNCNSSALTYNYEAPAPAAPYAFEARTTTFGFDDRKQFPVEVTNAAGHSETRTYDPKNGAVLSLTGPNGLTTVWQYDAFGRKLLERRADGTETVWNYWMCVSAGGTASCQSPARYMISSVTRDENNTYSIPPSFAFYDLADRVVRVRSARFDGASIDSVTEYDHVGRVARTSAPFAADQTPKWTNYGYDALGRTVAVTTPDGGVTTTVHNGLSTEVINAKNQAELRTVNSQGQLVSKKDAHGKTLTFEYDAVGNMTKTRDPLGNVILTTYNLRGQRSSLQDPDLGFITYGYNAAGELVSLRDNKNQTTSMEYDKLGRMTRRVEADLISTWHYDKYPGLLGLPTACGKSAGKLCRVSSNNNYDRTYRYDNKGRPDRVQTGIGATTYTMETSYDSHGQVSVVDYPTLFGVKYIRSLGFLREVRNKTTDALYWKANAMGSEGQLLQQTFGNNVVTHQTFDPNTNNVLTILSGNGGAVQNIEYQYDSIGNVLGRKDNNQALNETFGYDALNRLEFASVNSPGAGIHTTLFAFDEIGNIRERNDVGMYSYNSGLGAQRPHAVNSIAHPSGGSRQYSYDPNGNLTLELHKDSASLTIPALTRTTTYTSFNLPVSIARGGTTLEFVYGPEHQRVTQKIGNVTTTYVHPDNSGGLHYEKEVAPTKTEQRFFVSALGQVVAVVKKNGLGAVTATQYMHRDALGSVTAVTSEAGTVIERLAYEPYGKRRLPAGGASSALAGVQTDRGFTNHEHLDEVGLIHMNGRIYDPTVGRFMTADPLIQDGEGLQSYNRYSYTINNPLIYVDPSGFSWWGKQVNRFGNEVRRWERDFRHEIRRPNSLLGPILRVAGSALAIGCGGAAPGCIATVVGATEATVSRAQGVTGSDLLRNTTLSVASSLAFYSVGVNAPADSFKSYAGHALVGCGMAGVSGGNCAQGAAAAFVGKFATVQTADFSAPYRFAAAAAAGGTASVVTGGKFENGAVTAAFGYLFNQAMSSLRDAMHAESVKRSMELQMKAFGETPEGMVIAAQVQSDAVADLNKGVGAGSAACSFVPKCWPALPALGGVSLGLGSLSYYLDPNRTSFNTGMFLKDALITGWGFRLVHPFVYGTVEAGNQVLNHFYKEPDQ